MMIEKEFCIPVERDQRGFKLSKEWLECGLPFPTMKSLKKKLRKSHEIIDDKVLYEGEFVPAKVYIFKDEQEIPLAVLGLSMPDADDVTDEDEKSRDYLFAVRDSCRFNEYVYPEQKSRVTAVFIQPRLSRLGDNSDNFLSLSSIQSKPRVLITGPAGGGKTTILRSLVQSNAEASLSSPYESIPVYIQCRYFYRQENFLDAVKQQIKSLKGDRIIEQFSSLAKKGKFWFAFDGVDEVPSECRKQFSSELLAFVAAHKECKYFVTTRWGFEDMLDSSFLKMTTTPFNDNQIAELAYHQLYASKSWRVFLERSIEESEITDLIRNPLILSILVARFLRREHTPHLHTEVLSDVVSLLVDQWDSSRGVVRSLKNRYSSKLVFRGLSRIAAYLESENRSEFDIEDVRSTLRFVFDEEESGGFKSSILEELSANTSIIKRKKNEKWSFVNRAIQEYLASVSMVDELADYKKNAMSLLDEQKGDKDRRFLRYLLGSASDSTDVVYHVLDALFPAKKELRLLQLLNYALSERVSLDPDVAARYSKLLASMTSDVISKVDSFSLIVDQSDSMKLQIGATSKDNATLENLANYCQSLRSLRDGTMGGKVQRAFEQSDDQHVRRLTKLITSEGVLTFTIESNVLKVEIARIYPNIQ